MKKQDCIGIKMKGVKDLEQTEDYNREKFYLFKNRKETVNFILEELSDLNLVEKDLENNYYEIVDFDFLESYTIITFENL